MGEDELLQDASLTNMAARHLDPGEGVMRPGHVVTGADVSALNRVLPLVAAVIQCRDVLGSMTGARTITRGPRDALVVLCPGRVTMAEAARITDRLPVILGEPGLRVLVFDGGMDVAVLAEGAEPDPAWGRQVDSGV